MRVMQVGRVGWARAAVGTTIAALAVACSASTSPPQGKATPGNGCAPQINERLDSRSSIHLFGSAPEPYYTTDPPTSGPHRLGPPYRGALTAPIARSSQVAMLESGFVVLQYQNVPADQVAALSGLTGALVTVAPPAGALPTPVVATAWTWKLECGSAASPALSAIRAFISAHQGVGFAGNIPITTPST